VLRKVQQHSLFPAHILGFAQLVSQASVWLPWAVEAAVAAVKVQVLVAVVVVALVGATTLQQPPELRTMLKSAVAALEELTEALTVVVMVEYLNLSCYRLRNIAVVAVAVALQAVLRAAQAVQAQAHTTLRVAAQVVAAVPPITVVVLAEQVDTPVLVVMAAIRARVVERALPVAVAGLQAGHLTAADMLVAVTVVALDLVVKGPTALVAHIQCLMAASPVAMAAEELLGVAEAQVIISDKFSVRVAGPLLSGNTVGDLRDYLGEFVLFGRVQHVNSHQLTQVHHDRLRTFCNCTVH
jgi:hypothetical protein